MSKIIRIGTRDSQLALWQAARARHLLKNSGLVSEIVTIKSEGDLDLTTPLYAMGVQGIFTRSLDQALLNNQIDLAVHSMKDVPVQLPKGIVEAAVLERDNPFDLLVVREKTATTFIDQHQSCTIASSSLRRKSQWLHRFPDDIIEPIRGNVNTRLKKLGESKWAGAIFAAAGLERIGLRPVNAIELDWMLPAPAQGALLVLCRESEKALRQSCAKLNDDRTAFCTKIERDFLSALMGGCSTPIGALAEIENEEVYFRGNISGRDGKHVLSIEKRISTELAASLGISAAHELLADGGYELIREIEHV